MFQTPKFLRASLVIAATALAASTTVLAPAGAEVARPHAARPVANAELDFEIVNDTGYDIAHLYVSPTSKGDWGDNILSDTLVAGDSVQVTFHPEATASYWDVRADWVMEEGADQEYVYWKKLDLSKITRMTLHYNLKQNKTWATYE